MTIISTTETTLFLSAADFADPAGPPSLRGRLEAAFHELVVVNFHGAPPVPDGCVDFLHSLLSDERGAPRIVLTETAAPARRILVHEGLLPVTAVNEGEPGAPISIPMWMNSGTCRAPGRRLDVGCDAPPTLPARSGFVPIGRQEVGRGALSR